MEPEGSLPHSQASATCPYPEPDRSSPHSHIPLTEDPSKYYRPIYACVYQVVSSLRFPDLNTLYDSPLPHTRYMSCLSHYFLFYHPNNVGRRVQMVLNPIGGLLLHF